VGRATRGIAGALYSSGRKSDAIGELHKQTDLEQDNASLRQLGLYLRLSERETESIKWLSKALRLNPNDKEAKDLLAGAYEALGRKAFAAGQSSVARENFGLAVTYLESAQLLYLAGISASQTGNLRDAAAQYERMLKLRVDPATLNVAVSGWLNLLECYVLLGEYDLLEQRGQDASNFLRWQPDSRLLATYLRIVGRVIADPKQTVDELKKEPSYRDLESIPDDASPKRMRWSNDQIDEYIQKNLSDTEKRKFVDEVASRVWREPGQLK
jgi:tetratricopeptide (TPR) repeat protein